MKIRERLFRYFSGEPFFDEAGGTGRARGERGILPTFVGIVPTSSVISTSPPVKYFQLPSFFCQSAGILPTFPVILPTFCGFLPKKSASNSFVDLRRRKTLLRSAGFGKAVGRGRSVWQFYQPAAEYYQLSVE
jgi:hypothetical protein